MKIIACVAALGLAIGGTTFAQAPGSTQSPSASSSASTQSGAATATPVGTGNAAAQAGLAQGTAITAELARGLDTKKAKEGDQVQAKVVQDVLSAGKVVLPRNSKLIGHVTEAKAGPKGQASSLGIAFDKAVLKDGKEIPIHGVIQALAPPPRAPSAQGAGGFPSDDGGAAPMGGNAGGYAPAGGMNNAPIGGAPAAPVGGTAGTATGATNGVGATTTNTAGGEPNAANEVGMTSTGRLTAGSHGVMGMPGLTIDTGASNASNGTVVTNQNRNVKLDGGTQLVLRVTTQ